MAGDRSGPADSAARARALIDMRRWEEALRVARQGLAEDPTDARLHCLCAQALLALARPEEAQQPAEAAIAASPTSEWAHRLRALALAQQAKGTRGVAKRQLLDGAVDSARQAVTLAPTSAAGFTTLTEVEAARGNSVGADEASRQAIALAPGSSEAWVARSVAGIKTRNWQAAEAAARKALELDPNSWPAHNNLGVALRGQGHNRRAAAEFTSAGRINPQAPVVHHNLAQIGRMIVVVVPFIVLLPLTFGHATSGYYVPVSFISGIALTRHPTVRRWSTKLGIRLGRSTFPIGRPLLVAFGVVLAAVFIIRPITGLWIVGFCSPFVLGIWVYRRYDRRRHARQAGKAADLTTALPPARDVTSGLLIALFAMVALVAGLQWARLSTEPARTVLAPAIVCTLIACVAPAALIRRRSVLRSRYQPLRQTPPL